ncbi:MAG: HAD family hydrolase [Ruminococcaceae bacterium]|nr:HAD family hydrolase [Oscillospiraceae bacterium]
MKKVGILFDLDGTLMDTIQDLTDSVNFALSKFNLPLRENWQTRKVLGNGAKSLITQSMPGREDDPPVDAVLAVFKEHYAVHSQDKTRPYDGVAEVVEKLSRDYPVAVVSNKPDFAVKSLCDQFFPGIYAIGERPDCPRKPAPDMLLRTMAELGVENCVYVGDSEVDVTTARNAGCPCVTVLWGFRDEPELVEAGADRLCNQVSDLYEMIVTAIRETISA